MKTVKIKLEQTISRKAVVLPQDDLNHSLVLLRVDREEQDEFFEALTNADAVSALDGCSIIIMTYDCEVTVVRKGDTPLVNMKAGSGPPEGRLAGGQEEAGSIPASPTDFYCDPPPAEKDGK